LYFSLTQTAPNIRKRGEKQFFPSFLLHETALSISYHEEILEDRVWQAKSQEAPGDMAEVRI
jgi:hypothetical protein